MNTFNIILAQSATSAMIEIALLILGAALIAFFTAWFYQKSVYTPVIKGLEADKEELNKRISGLNNDINGFKARINDLEGTIDKQNKEIEQLKKPKK